MSYELAWEPRGVVKRFAGNVSGKEFEQAASAVGGDGRFDDLRFIIVDFLGVAAFSISRDSLDYVAAIENAAAMSNPKISVAVLATAPEALRIAAQYCNSPGKLYPAQRFASEPEAREWLAEASLTSSCVLPQHWLHWDQE